MEAELFDLKLRLRESQERERRLIELNKQLEEEVEDAPKTEHQLRRELNEFAAFHNAVERSRTWKIIQAARALVGRKW